MLDLFTLAILLLFSPSLDALSSPCFHRREAATIALRSPLAFPAVRARLRTETNPEALMRLQGICTDEAYILGRWMLDHPAALTFLCQQLDRQHPTFAAGWEKWIKTAPYCAGTAEGEVWEAVRRTNKACKPLQPTAVYYPWSGP